MTQLKWARSKPTVCGWYWIRGEGEAFKTPRIITVTLTWEHRGLIIQGEPGYPECRVQDAHPSFEYWGPLTPPKG